MRVAVAARSIVLVFASTTVLFAFQNCNPMKFTPAADFASLNLCETNPLDPVCQPLPIPICTFNGVVVPSGQYVTAYLNSTVPYGSTCQSEERQCLGGSLTGSYNFASCNVDSPADCLFNGQTIAHGDNVAAFLNSSVAFGNTCSQETRVCNNGTLSGSFTYAACNVDAPNSCLFNGQTIAHGQSVQAYATSTVPYGFDCTPTTRTCNNGNLSSSGDFSSCTPDAPASCTFNGQAVAHGQVVIAYQNSTVPFGSSCVPQQRTCTNGTLSGSYAFASCTPNAPASCQFNGRQVAHNETVRAYQNSTVPYGEACVGQDRTCSNGALSGSYNFGSCTPGAPANCTFNGSTVTHGQSVVAYADSTVPFGNSCTGVTRTCNNGSLSGSGNFSSCNVGAPADCLLSGQTVAHGQSITAYESSAVPYGNTCSTQSRTCYNGSLSGSATYTHLNCNVGAPANCTFNGQPLAHGQSVVAFIAESVPYSSQCLSTNRTCDNGSLDGNSSYNSANCTVEGPPATFGVVANSSVDEGASIAFELSGTDIPDGATFNYSLTGTNINSNDFSNGRTAGSVSFTSNKGVASIAIRADLTTEGPETFYFKLFNTDGTVAVEKSILINDTSLTPNASLTGPGQIREGYRETFILTTEDIPDGTNVSYCYDRSGAAGHTNSNDFNGGCSSARVTNNQASILIEAFADLLTEGEEQSYLQIIVNGVVIAHNNFTVLDTSQTPTGTLSGPATINEGVAANFALSTQGVPDGTFANLCFDSSGSAGRTDRNDFDRCVGVNVMSSSAVFAVTAIADLLTEGNESSYARVLIAGTEVSRVNFTVIDTSRTPTGSISGPALVDEGVKTSFTFTSQGIPNNTSITYCLDTSGAAGRTNRNDFNDGCRSATVNNNVATMTIEAWADLFTEGNEGSYIRVSVNGTQIAQHNFTVNDVSKSPTGTITGPATVDEGTTGIFTLNTQGVPNGITLSYCFENSSGAGHTNQSDFSGCRAVIVNNNTAQLQVSPLADYRTEGDENSYVRITIENRELAARTFIVRDTSRTPTGNLTGGASTIDEGNSASFTLTTQGLPNGSNVNFCFDNSGASGRTNSSDFNSSCTSATIMNNTATVTVAPRADLLTESDEGSYVRATFSGTTLAQANFTVRDTSKTPNFSGSITSAQTVYPEGSNVRFDISTTGTPNGTVIAYDLSGSGITASDVVGSTLNGTVTVQNGMASVTIGLRSDGVAEGNEVLVFTLRPQNASPISSSVTIKDP